VSDDRWPGIFDPEDDGPGHRSAVAQADGPGGPPPLAAPAGASPSGPRKRRPVARTMHVFGELLLTLGAVLLLFVGYQLWWTGVETGQAQDDIKDQLAQQWDNPLQPGETPPSPGESPGEEGLADVDLGEGIGIIRIPRFGPSYAWAVVEGVRLEDLARGPGHYPESAMPGEVGNFAVAGHRATHGEPFAQFEALRVGDEVVVETATQWFTYTIYDIQYPVPVTSSWAITPHASQEPLVGEPTRQLMTLTTCHPRWASTYRFLVFSELSETTPKVDAEGNEVLPPALAAFAPEA
jgi:sortase A